MDYVVLRGFARSVIKPNADFINNLTAFGSDWRYRTEPRPFLFGHGVMKGRKG